MRRAGAPDEQFHDVGTLAVIEATRKPPARVDHPGVQRHGAVSGSPSATTWFTACWIASVSQLDRDLSIPIPEDLKKTATALTQVLHTLHARDALNPAAALPTPEQLDDCGWVANRWCELLPVPMELKQRLMELDNPLVRLELVGDVLERTGIAQ